MSFSFQVKAKKTPFQRQKELEEEKKRRDDEEAAKVYEDFVKDFAVGEENERNSARGPKAFVRGGVIQPGRSALPPPAAEPVRRGGSGKGYVPSFLPPGMAAAVAKKEAEESDGAGGGAGSIGPTGGSGSTTPAAPPPRTEESVFQLPSSRGGKPRAIDALLENLKKEQEQRELRKEQGLPPLDAEGKGSYDQGDPTTTNLYIGNLAPDVDEQVLYREFGRFGPIGSVKIMWPRDEEQRRRGRNNGFVLFMQREDAEKALEALDGVTLHDYMITIGWGKMVPLPSAPSWPPPGGLAAAREGGTAVPPPMAAAAALPPPSAVYTDDRGVPRAAVGIPQGPAGARGAERPRGVGPDVDVQIPSDPRQRFVVDAVAFYVMRDGCEFEQVVMERERSNPEFGFLFDVTCPEHAYYRWRLFSLAAGDSLRSWRVDPFQMVEGSALWLPPPMTVGVTGHKTAAQRGDRREDLPLSDLQRDRFEDLLRILTAERAEICSAMAFALDNAESASEVAEILGDSLTLSETPIPLKIARLFLISDILHNSTAPVRNASRYRLRLEELLPDVFESLQEAYRSADGRMAQELLRRHVLKVLRVWRGWFIFADDFLNGLQATFLRSGTGGGGDGSSGMEGGSGAPDEALEAELEALPDEEVEARCRRSGLSRKGGRGAQVSRLLALDAYLNGGRDGRAAARPAAGGEALGAGTLRAAAKPTSSWAVVEDAAAPAQQNQLPKSKWEQLDAATEEEQQPAVAAASAPLAESRLGSGPVAASGASGEAAGGGAGTADSDSDDDLFAAARRNQQAGGAAGARLTTFELPNLAPHAHVEAAGPAAGTPAAQPSATADAAAAALSSAADEERRARLRQVEVAVMLYREELEERGGLSREAIEAKAAERRAKLQAEAEAAAAQPPAQASEPSSGSKSRQHRGRDPAGSSRHGSGKERKRSRSADRGRERKRSRTRSAERSARRRSRSRHRSRSKQRSKRGVSRSRSRSRRRR